MTLVIPKWAAHAVRDWGELLVTTADGKHELNEATAALINYLPLVGITELTVDNVNDAWRRIALFQAVLGTVVSDRANKQPVFITRSDVERHIGIQTDGKQLTFEEFCQDIKSRGLEMDEAKLPSFIANGKRTLLQAAGIGWPG